MAGKVGKEFFGLEWLLSFDDDVYRLIAVGLFFLAIVIIFTAKPLAEIWAKDRANKRKYKLENSKLQNKLGRNSGSKP